MTSLYSRINWVSPESIWCLGSSPPKPRCWADKLCCLPKPRSHSSWSGLKFSRAWLSPFSLGVLKLVGGCFCSHAATTTGNEGSFIDWHLIWSGSLQWSLQIGPGPDGVCASAAPPLHSPRQNGQDFVVKHQSKQMKMKMFSLSNSLCSICLQLVRQLKFLKQECSKASSWTWGSLDWFEIQTVLTRDVWFSKCCIAPPCIENSLVSEVSRIASYVTWPRS